MSHGCVRAAFQAAINREVADALQSTIDVPIINNATARFGQREAEDLFGFTMIEDECGNEVARIIMIEGIDPLATEKVSAPITQKRIDAAFNRTTAEQDLAHILKKAQRHLK
jgi:hypothetical protein